MNLETRFTLKDFIKVMASIGLLLCAAILGFNAMGTDLDFLSTWHPAAVFLLIYLFQFVLIYLPLWIWVIRPYFATAQDFQFKPVSAREFIKTILSLYALFMLISVSLALAASQFGFEIPGYQAQESYLPFFGTDPLGIIVGFLTVAVIAPLIEEVFFRGFVLPIFLRIWPRAWASFLCALLFAAVHFQPQSILPLIILGLLLNAAALKTNSIWTALGFHAFNNSIAFALELYLYFHPQIPL